jgi:hypothetical protein
MSTKLNAEELAAKRFGIGAWIVHWTPVDAYAAAIREVAQPIADERDEAIKHLQYLTEHWSCEDGTITPFAEDVENAVNFLAKYPRP